MSQNEETLLTLDEAVAEVLGLLTGLDLEYEPEQDRYRAVTRQLNRALRSNALEHEWSYYADTREVGTAVEGEQYLDIPATVRPRMIGDDAVRLCDEDGVPIVWAFFMVRDALHKYANHTGLWCSVVRNTITFSRPFNSYEDGMSIQVPVMREPIMFRLPAQPEDPEDGLVTVPDEIREQEIDFWYPDVICLRAAMYVAASDPVMQPRVQTLEAQYKDLMYQIIERDDRNTDTPFQNTFDLGIQTEVLRPTVPNLRPTADWRP